MVMSNNGCLLLLVGYILVGWLMISERSKNNKNDHVDVQFRL